MMKICVSGLGRAGSQLAKFLLGSDRAELVSGVCSPGSPKAGRDLGEIVSGAAAGVPVYPADRLESCVFRTGPDVAVDFSRPEAALRNAEIFFSGNVRVVMGTTGFGQAEKETLYELADRTGGGLIWAPNITRGVNVLMLLSELAARFLNGYDAEIIEMHHRRKLDAPSGTAAKLAENLRGAGRRDVPVSSVRAGGIVSCHKVLLAGENDMIELTHQSFSRDAFAEGALCAAEFIFGKTGLYEMRDAMNFDEILEEYLNRDRDSDRPARRLALV